MNRHLQLGGMLMPGDPRPGHHRFAMLFPMLPEDRRPSFRASLDEGQNHSIVLFKGQILDGRNRERELFELGKPVAYVVFNGDDRAALDFVNAENLERRHLSEGQRAMLAAEVASMRIGDNQHEVAPIGAPLLQDDEPEAEPAPLISQTEAADVYSVGRRSVQRAAVVKEKGVPELVEAVKAGELAVSAAEKIARMPEADQPAALQRALPTGNRAIMASRREPDDSLDYFPTPPWATRALVERVFVDAGLPPVFFVAAMTNGPSVWEPFCGEGHIAEVLREYGCDVFASDIFDYGYQDALIDFLVDPPAIAPEVDWIVSNSPFGSKCEQSILYALKRARVGVAMFVPLRWLETIGRYERVFKDQPPSLIAFFAERVNLCKGRWDPEGSTATAYIWLVWIHGVEPRPPYWIPPGCKDALTRPDDARRFTQKPVERQQQSLEVETTEAAE